MLLYLVLNQYSQQLHYVAGLPSHTAGLIHTAAVSSVFLCLSLAVCMAW